MRRACIDIGSNTTRLLVADCSDASLQEVHQERAFTRIGGALSADGTIAATKIAEVALVVARQLWVANELGVSDVQVVATASVRGAANGDVLVAAVADSCGQPVRVLSEREEARLAFIGAVGTLQRPPDGELGVIDVGGGSTELAVGTAPDRVRWSVSLPIGSGVIADRCLGDDPPTPAQLQDARERIAATLAGVEVPRPRMAVAVGGSATSLRRLAGAHLDRDTLTRVLGVLTAGPAAEVAANVGLDPQRIRLLPAGLLILKVVGERFGVAPAIGCGGIREGLLLEANREGARAR
jgi:exopolyphosphatase/guanosine-5'-triphosphate,3'-diphosphate pyrophosphatase